MTLFGTIRAPRELIFGSGQRQALGAVAAKLGQRALVVTDERLAGDGDFDRMVALVDRGLAAGDFSGRAGRYATDVTMAETDAQHLRRAAVVNAASQ